jgi:hypothetical protein
MPNTQSIPYTANPLSTVTINGFFSKDLVANYSVKIGSLPVTASTGFTTTNIDTTNVPAVYYLYAPAATTATKSACGFIHILTSGQIAVTAAQRLATSSSTADDVVVSLSSGTLTVNTASTTSTETKDVYLFRVL